jgi:hypothetical protein
MPLISSTVGRAGNARLWDVLEAVSCGVAVVLFLAFVTVWYQYAETRPRVAEPSIGRIYSLDTHGVVVYLTQLEQSRLYALAWGAGLCFLLGAIIGIFVKKTWHWNPRR